VFNLELESPPAAEGQLSAENKTRWTRKKFRAGQKKKNRFWAAKSSI